MMNNIFAQRGGIQPQMPMPGASNGAPVRPMIPQVPGAPMAQPPQPVGGPVLPIQGGAPGPFPPNGMMPTRPPGPVYPTAQPSMAGQMPVQQPNLNAMRQRLAY